MRPIIGITSDCFEGRFRVSNNYATCITIAGGLPIMLPPILDLQDSFLDLCDGFVFTGGDDPLMEQWGIETDPSATPCDKDRQQFETSMLEKLSDLPHKPVFGICLGMQWMGLLAGGTLIQDLEPKFAAHHKSGSHLITGALGEGVVHSSHHQAMKETGSLTISAFAEDGIVEAVYDPNRNWYVGVQWHPERTEDERLGQGLFNQFCEATKS